MAHRHGVSSSSGQASSSSSSSASGSSSPPATRRNGAESRSLEVRVWYTLESSPHRMLASSGRQVDVELLPPLEALRSSDPKGKAPERPPRLAEVTLKTCLSAICISSPELILDRKRDYILYAVDPVETYRSTAHRTRTPSASREPVFRGKGFFGWILEEEGDGDTVVVGKVSEVGRRRSASWSDDDSDEYDDTAYLDVEIRMKETEAQTREQFFARLGQFGTASAAGGRPAAAATTSASTLAAPAPAPVASKRKIKSSSRLSSSSSSRPPLAHSASSPIRRTHSTPTVRTAPVQAQAPSSGQAQALQVLQLLQTLQAQQQQQQQAQEQPAPSPAAAATPSSSSALEALLRMSGGVGDNTALLTRALGDAFKAAGLKVPSPIKSLDSRQPTPSSSSNKLSRSKSSSSTGASDPIGELRQCYNCGIIQSQQSVWRLPVLLEGTKVQVPDAFVHDPHRGPNGTRPDDQDLTPDEETGCVLANGRSTWRACNRCGLFYTKWKKNRPEKVSRKARDHTAADDAVSSPAPQVAAAPQPAPPAPAPGPVSAPPPQPPSSSSRKRASPEVDEIFEGEGDGEDEEEGDATQDEILGSSPPAPGGKRTKRDIDKELIKDKYGQWRSRRSVRENPEGRRSGRPQGRKNASAKKSRGKRSQTSEARDESESAAECSKTPAAAGDTPADSSKDTTQQQQQDYVTQAGHAQTSPLRSNSAAGPPIVPIRTFPWSNVPPNAASLQSTPTNLTPTRRSIRYGAPSNILMSSPATALDQLLSEDFTFDFGNHTIGGGGGPGGVTQSSPIRRSPRKNPMGTRDTRNPFATTATGAMMAPNAISTGSPSRPGANDAGMDANLFDMDIFSAFTNFKSPSSIVSSSEASKKPSPSSQSSQDAEASERRRSLRTRTGGPSSGAVTSLTSPSSPSPASHKRMRGHTFLQSSSPSVMSVKGLGARDDDEDEDEDVSDSPSRAKEQRLKATSGPICPASPSLGQKRKRDASGAAGKESASAFATPAAAASASSPSMLTKGPSPAPNSASRRRGSAGSHITTPRVTPRKSAQDDGNTTILAVTSSSRPPSASPALRKRIPSQSPRNLLVPGRRKPLPATVEDAPPSSAGSSPGDGEDDEDEDEVAFSPYDHASVNSLLEMFEDPYGILAANGIGLPGANVVANNGGNGGAGAVANGGGGGVAFSMDHFDDIQLHDRNQFPAHLRTFTQEGARGVAALAVPGWQQQQQQQQSGSGVAQGGNEQQQNATPAALTPTEDGSTATGKPSTPGKKGSSSSRPTAPLTPTRSSPRFHSTPNGGKGRVAVPPRTPSGDQGRASSSKTAPSSTAAGAGPPRTPLAKLNNLSPDSLAALSRSPALQKALSNVVATTASGGTTGSPGTFDFTALFGSNAASLGSLSPFFATPRGPAGGKQQHQQAPSSSMGLPPLSPSLSRVLSQYGEATSGGATPQQQHQSGGADADALALVPGSGSGTGEITASDLQQLFGDDPSWAAFLGAMGGGAEQSSGAGQGEQQQEQEDGQGKKAVTRAAAASS